MTAVGAEVCIECGQNPRAASGRLSRCLECVKAAAQRDREARERRLTAKKSSRAGQAPTPTSSPDGGAA